METLAGFLFYFRKLFGFVRNMVYLSTKITTMTTEEVRPYLIYEVIAGSKAYGLDLPTSDTDIRGIYMLPNDYLLGKGYDGKNLMHCLRMLDMAVEVAEGKGVNLVRPNRDWLLSVRRGEADYDTIIALIEEKKIQMDDAFNRSTLPDSVSDSFVHKLLLEMRS